MAAAATSMGLNRNSVSGYQGGFAFELPGAHLFGQLLGETFVAFLHDFFAAGQSCFDDGLMGIAFDLAACSIRGN